MDSTTASPTPTGDHLAIPSPHPSAISGRPKRRVLPKVLSGFLVMLGVVLLKLKALVFLAFENVRLLFANPFEGFGVTQYAVAGGTMLLSIGAYALKAPLRLAIGFMIIIVVHETGHAVVMRAKGLRPSILVFIPFLGGAVTPNQQPRNAYDDAQIGLAGPLAGTLASLAALQVYKWTGAPSYLAIAFLGFIINLLNLLPLGMLDGGRISGAITKWMWVFGGAALTYKTISQPNPLMIVILVLAAFQVYFSILREGSEKFYEVTAAQKVAVAIAYFTLVVFLSHQAYLAYGAFERLAAIK
jgi:Zn-dependent protease